jgi:hypothetical protein
MVILPYYLPFAFIYSVLLYEYVPLLFMHKLKNGELKYKLEGTG